MRLVLGAAIAALACSAAWAQTTPTSDKANSFSFDKPQKWPALEDKTPSGSPMKLYVAGTANEECWFNIIPRPETASATVANLVRGWSKTIPPEEWVATTKGSPLLTTGGEYKSSSVDTSKTFPIQQAVIQGKDGPVVVAMHPRPGQEIRVYCTAYDGKDHNDAFKTIAASVSTPRDAEYKTQATAAQAEEAAPAAAAAAPPADTKKKK